jgi:hypothetical protein
MMSFRNNVFLILNLPDCEILQEDASQGDACRTARQLLESPAMFIECAAVIKVSISLSDKNKLELTSTFIRSYHKLALETRQTNEPDLIRDIYGINLKGVDTVA